jgi:hypothetical protein
MSALVQCVVTIGLCCVAATDIKNAAMTKSALDGLLTRLDEINRAPEMTTAKKAIVSADEMEKFTQQYKGQPLTIRLKIQDLLPNAKGHCATAGNPDLTFVQTSPNRYQLSLSKAEVMSFAKGSSLVISGTLSGVMQSKAHFNPNVFEPGSKLSFPLRGNPSYGIWLENTSWKVENAPPPETKAPAVYKPEVSSGSSASTSHYLPESPKTSTGTNHGTAFANVTKNETSWSAGDIKTFFLKGITQPPHQPGSTTTGLAGLTNRTNPAYPSTPASTTGSASLSRTLKGKHNRVYIADELIHKFGKPSTRTSTMNSETWTYNCTDGVVHVHFTQLGFVGGSSASKTEQVRLEATSVDSTSVPARTTGRY